MAGKADGSVLISFDADVSKADKELERLRKKALRLEENLTVGKYKKSALVAELEKARAEYDKLQKQVDINNVGKAVRTEENLNQMIELGNEIKSIESNLEKQNILIHETELALDGVKERYGEVAVEAQKITEAADDATEAVEEKAQSILDKMKSLLSEFANSLKLGLQGIAQGIWSTLKTVFSKIGSAISTITKTALNALKKLPAAIGKIAKRLNVFSRLADSLSGTLKKLGSTIKRAFIFSVIYKGLSLVKDQISSYLLVNDQFSAALGRVKGALLTAFQPIYDVVVPALTTLLNVLSRVIAAVTQFTASLFGTSAKQAQSNAKALYEQAKATEETGTAAEDAASSLAGFDEINTLSSGDKAGNSSGTADTAAPTFDMVLDDTVFQTWGQAFDTFLDNLLNNGIPTLEAGLSEASEKLNGFSAKALEMFTFPGALDKVKKIGNDLAAAFNNMMVGINWDLLGQAMGAGLNTAIAFAVSFLYSVDWAGLGSSLAELLNGIVTQIDWYSFGMLLFSGFKIGIETLAGFILGLDVVEIAQAFGNFVIGFMDAATKTIAGIDWEGIGRQVKEFLVNIDWNNVANATFTAIGAAFGALTGFLWGLIRDAWKAVVNWWHDVAYEDGKFTLQGLLDGIVDVCKNIGAWIKEHIFDPFIEGFRKVFGIHSPSTVMAEQGVYIMQGLMNGVVSMVASVVSVFSGLWTSIQGVFSHITDWFRDKFSEAWQAVKDVFSSGGKVFDGIKDGILDGLKAVINALIAGINKVIAVPFNGINSALKKIRSIEILGFTPFSGISTISVPQIPKLAEGAVIPPNREFLAVLGDQRRGTNIETPLATMVEAFKQALTESESGGTYTFVLNLDGREVARNTIRHMNDMTRERGKSVVLV